MNLAMCSCVEAIPLTEVKIMSTDASRRGANIQETNVEMLQETCQKIIHEFLASDLCDKGYYGYYLIFIVHRDICTNVPQTNAFNFRVVSCLLSGNSASCFHKLRDASNFWRLNDFSKRWT